MQAEAVEEGILKRDIQMRMVMAKEGIQKVMVMAMVMMMIAKEGIQKRRHTLRREERTYTGSQMESRRRGDSPEETRMPRLI